MYREFIKRKYPHNASGGSYVAPNLPGSKLGRILAKEKRVAQPGDVVAMYLDSGFFGSTYVLFTGKKCFSEEGEFDLDRVRKAEADGKSVKVYLGNRTGTTTHDFKVGNSEVARTVAKFLDDLAYHDPEQEVASRGVSQADYAQFEGQALDWLLLRDEVMKTLDMLYEKFQEGKLSLIEYENKKAELLGRL